MPPLVGLEFSDVDIPPLRHQVASRPCGRLPQAHSAEQEADVGVSKWRRSGWFFQRWEFQVGRRLQLRLAVVEQGETLLQNLQPDGLAAFDPLVLDYPRTRDPQFVCGAGPSATTLVPAAGSR